MTRIQRTFVREKETKNTVKFTEECDAQPPVVGALYVQKWTKPPARITVTLDPGELPGQG